MATPIPFSDNYDAHDDSYGYNWASFEGLTLNPPTITKRRKRYQIANKIEEAKKRNSAGVHIVGLSVENMAHIAGYLNFRDSGVTVRWFEDTSQLPTILETWRAQREVAFGCPIRDGMKPSEKEFRIDKLFRFIVALTPKQITSILGSDFPVTHKMLDVKDTQDDPGSFLTFMRCTGEIHSSENWYRAIIVLRIYWATHRFELKVRTKAYTPKPAIKPIWVTSKVGNVNGEGCEAVDYSTYKDDEYDCMLNIANQESVFGDDNDPTTIEETNVREIEELHKALNQTGDVSKEATARATKDGKKERLAVKPQDLNVYCTRLAGFLKRRINETKAIKGPMKESADEHPFLKKTMKFADTLDSIKGLSKEDVEEFENGKKKFCEVLEQMSTASAAPKSFVESCKDHGIDYYDPKNIKIEGTKLTPCPHQAIDMAWLADMEDTFLGGGILAAECGSGKTVIILLFILMTHRKLTASGSNNHFATLVVVPSAVVDETELHALDPKNPETSKTFFLTSYTTFARRAMRVNESKMVTKDDSIEKDSSSDKDEVDCMAVQDERILQKFELTFDHKGILGRVALDEAHLIKNPCTISGDAIYKMKIPRTNPISATPMINRINDLRGLLIQLMKWKELPLNLPTTLQGLVSIYHEGFDPINDLPKELGGIRAKSIVPPKTNDPNVVRLYQALEAKFPIHIMCPKAYFSVGAKSDWSPSVAREVLRPILQVIQRRRLMSNTFETIDGQFETPGKDIPHYTVKTIKLRMSPKQSALLKKTTLG
ncbi:hypothetical protein DSL72_002087 [Monilinia vaccinii-corymbosi]|uniref:Helicase ATP-binding domain-containing protein n=1 Tax=Monilinia vaccinii-corymbosi TaxID=61207 RepID=A0A8A3PBP2_9HELO|nr:hypothetical protein DSL72_002087 [Monilinia vaccinii-corymbosi]